MIYFGGVESGVQMAMCNNFTRSIGPEKNESGLLIVLSGPSGVGKDAVLKGLEMNWPSLRRCVTITTRPPRNGEQDGVDYTFVSVDEFRRMVEAGDFLQYAQVHGNMYGTPRRWVEENLREGTDVGPKIDVQGGIAVKKLMPSAIMVFLSPPSLEELERRLRSRLTETENEVTKRLLDARKELQEMNHYDYVVVNDSLDCAVEHLKAVIIAEHCRIK